MQRLFVFTDIENGIYGVMWCKNGGWEWVIVDDWIAYSDVLSYPPTVLLSSYLRGRLGVCVVPGAGRRSLCLPHILELGDPPPPALAPSPGMA